MIDPETNSERSGSIADHAYWLSGLKLRSAGGDAPIGSVNARSSGFGKADPPAKATQHSVGTLDGGNSGPMTYLEQSKSWGKAPSTPRRNVLRIDAQNLSQIVVHPRRARLSCDVTLQVKTDGPVKVRLAGCQRTQTFG